MSPVYENCKQEHVFLMSKQKKTKKNNLFSTCSCTENRNSMNNLSSYCGLVETKMRASDKYLPVPDGKS